MRRNTLGGECYHIHELTDVADWLVTPWLTEETEYARPPRENSQFCSVVIVASSGIELAVSGCQPHLSSGVSNFWTSLCETWCNGNFTPLLSHVDVCETKSMLNILNIPSHLIWCGSVAKADQSLNSRYPIFWLRSLIRFCSQCYWPWNFNTQPSEITDTFLCIRRLWINTYKTCKRRSLYAATLATSVLVLVRCSVVAFSDFLFPFCVLFIFHLWT